jgi:Tol biopolymer transport system component
MAGLLLAATVSSVAGGQGVTKGGVNDPAYTVAFASFAPLNTDIFIAQADGSGARVLFSSPALDYNASFSADGAWIVFTSERDGSSDLFRVRANGSGLERLTADPAFDDQGALSPDGESLAFVSTRSGQADIWILDLTTHALRNLTSHPAGDFRPGWSPDGRWIAFSTDRDSRKPKFTFTTLHSTEIYIVRPDGTGLRRITNDNAFAGSPAWSADGKRLVYYAAGTDEVQKIASPRRLRGITQIVTVDLATGEPKEVTSGPGEKWSPRFLPGGVIAYASGGPTGGVELVTGTAGARGEIRSPQWSADGRQMVFHRDVETTWPPLREVRSPDPRFRLLRAGVFTTGAPGGERLAMNDQRAGVLRNSIMVMNADGAGRSPLFSDTTRSALAPVWSPCGDMIAFGLGRFFQQTLGAATADIATIRRDGSGLRVLTDGSANFGLPSWSPDGRKLVYRVASADRNGLLIMDVATGAVTALTSGTAHDNFPAWSPKGDVIAFTSDRDGDFEIYTIRPDGTDVRRLTSTPGNDAHNAWSPDGEWIAFTSAREGFKDESALHPFNPQPYGEIHVMRADGSDVRRLTDNQFEEGTPAWIPARGSTQAKNSCPT